MQQFRNCNRKPDGLFLMEISFFAVLFKINVKGSIPKDPTMVLIVFVSKNCIFMQHVCGFNE